MNILAARSEPTKEFLEYIDDYSIPAMGWADLIANVSSAFGLMSACDIKIVHRISDGITRITLDTGGSHQGEKIMKALYNNYTIAPYFISWKKGGTYRLDLEDNLK